MDATMSSSTQKKTLLIALWRSHQERELMQSMTLSGKTQNRTNLAAASEEVFSYVEKGVLRVQVDQYPRSVTSYPSPFGPPEPENDWFNCVNTR
ncbi:hypothetical protein E3N88_21791 [Mikania micrantha]|uniref:Uncharacterized protein n=1 Tax=Mikania micrantha TaxID=192012 RepID=A0A5N6NAE8_9ASTR|nr:hypothetical protein E3N88_21791 [Mikania micrantha]